MSSRRPILAFMSFMALPLLTACGGETSSSVPLSVTPPETSQPETAQPTQPETPPASAAERFVDKIFDDVERSSNIVFGSGARSVEPQILEMDIYMPQGDSEMQRPVVILAFAGGFVGGSRRDGLITSIATDFAQRGYVTASIDYRLFETIPTSQDEALIGIIEAVHDMKAAVRFFREDAQGDNIYGTREDAIFVGGVSAGAVMASFSGALDNEDIISAPVQEFLEANNGLAGNSSSNTQINSDVQGVFSLSGAVADFQWIDENSAPIYAAHEEFDTVVPCRFSLSSGGLFLAGGCDMVPRAEAAGVPAELYLVEGSENHIGYSLSEFIEIFDGASAFLAAQIPQ